MKVKVKRIVYDEIEVSECGKYCGENPKCCNFVFYHRQCVYCDLFHVNEDTMVRLRGSMDNILRCQACIDAEKRAAALEGK